MERTYSEQEITMLIAGLRLLIEREVGLLGMVDDIGKKDIGRLLKRYRLLIVKLHSEV